MVGDPDPALSRLRARILHHVASGDAEAILHPDALADAAELIVHVAGGHEYLDAVSAVGWLHWARCHALPPDQAEHDLETSVVMFALIYRQVPQAVPDEVRAWLDQQPATDLPPNLSPERCYAPQIHPFATAIAHRGLLDSAIALSRAAVAATAKDAQDAQDEGHASMLSNLGLLLRIRFERMGEPADLDEAWHTLRAAATLFPREQPGRGMVMNNLGVVLMTRFGRTGDLADLTEAIDVSRVGLTLTPADDPNRGLFLSNLGNALRQRFQRAGDQADLDEAIDTLHDAVATRENHPNFGMYLCNLSVALRCRFERTGVVATLTDAIAAARAAVAAVAAEHADRGIYLANLGNVLQTRFERTGNQSDLAEAVETQRAAVAATPPEHALHGDRLNDLGIVLQTRFGRTGNLSDLDEAVEFCRASVVSTPEDDPRRGSRLSNLGLALRNRFDRTGHLNDVTGSVETLRAAVAATPPDDPSRAVPLSNLSISLRTRFERTGDLADLTEAIGMGRAALTVTPHDHPDRAIRLNTLGLALNIRFGRKGVLADLSEAIDVLRAAVDHTPEDHANRMVPLANLGNAVQTRFLRTGSMADLTEAIPVLRAALAATPEDHPNRAGMLSNLGLALTERFHRTGELADLTEAVDVHRAAVSGTPEDHPSRAPYLSNLGLALNIRFNRKGVLADLSEAIDVLRASVDRTAEDDRSRATSMDTLGGALWTRFERTGSLADLNESVDIGRVALSVTPHDHPKRASLLSNLGTRIQSRFRRTGDLGDLTEAIEMLRAAVNGIPLDEPIRGVALTNLGPALQARFEHADSTGDITDLTEAIDVGRAAVAAVPHDHPNRGVVLSNLAVALRMRFVATNALVDLDECIDVLRDSVAATVVDHPDRAIRMYNLGNSLKTRFDHTGVAADRTEALDLMRAVANSVSGDRQFRTWAATRWGLWAAQRRDWSSAVDGFTAAVELLPQVAWHGVDRATREGRLRESQGLASAAAACALSAGQPERAVELLEAGRSVLWAQALQTRDDFTALQDADPRLYARLATLATELDTAVADENARHAADRRVRLADEWDQLVGQARGLPGLAYFLSTPPLRVLRQGLPEHPVIIVNVAPYRCDALVVSRTSLTTVALTELSVADAADRVVAYLEALTVLNAVDRMDQHGGLERADAEQTVHATLEWLWDSVAAPVLDHLGHRAPPPPGRPWPRVWWCPTGLLTLLPLHAAGYHDADDELADRTVLDRVVSSYTPTLDSLTRARQPSVEHSVSDQRLLLVAMPSTPAAPGLDAPSDLPGAADEARIIQRCLRQGRAPAPTVRIGGQATRQAILAELPGHAYVHFACHGGQRLDHPSAGALYLDDGPLTVVDIAGLRLTHAELAFLSACQTAIGGVELLDESIHLAAALQLAGYRHVIGTLWTIADQPGPEIAQDVYTALTSLPETNAHGHLDLTHTARALHAAVRRLRDRHRGNPMVWAPYLHAGP